MTVSVHLWLWLAWLLVGAGYEIWGVWGRRAGDDTLSELTLVLTRADTKVGWFALMLLMGFLAAWFPGHVRNMRRRRYGDR